MKTINIFLIAIIIAFSLNSCVATVRPLRQIVIVKTLPRYHKVYYIKGVKYYKWNGYYHRKTSRGYVVISRH